MAETQNSLPPPEILAAEHMSPQLPDHAIGLGRRAVDLSLRGEIESEPFENAITGVRLKLQGQLLDNRDQANGLLNSSELPDSLKHILGAEDAGEPGFDMVGLLTAKKPDRSYVVSDRAFANFLEWHNYNLAAKQAELDKFAEAYKPAYIGAIHNAVDEGWLPASTLEQLPRLDETRLIIDDGFATTLEGAHGFAHTDRDGNRYVVLEPGELDEQDPRKTIFHEFNHVLGGSDVDPEANYGRALHGGAPQFGLYRLFGKAGKITNEAFVEHWAQAMKYGNFDVIDPDSAERGNIGSYQPYRRLLNALCNAGVEKVDIRLFAAEHCRQPDLSIDPERARTMHELFGDPMPDLTDREPNADLIAALQRGFPFTDVISEVKQLDPDNDQALGDYIQSLHDRTAAYH